MPDLGISEKFEISLSTVKRDLKEINNSATSDVYQVDALGRITRTK
nr:MAG TPA: Mga helix-turn-helix domain [Caudoviricetes sp.]